MFSRPSVLIAAVVMLNGLARGLDVKHQAAYNRVTDCMKVGLDAAKDLHKTTSNRDALLCHFWKVMHQCLVAPFDSSPDDSKILDFFRAYEWQLAIMSTKSHLCSSLDSVEKLKDLAVKSGIMETESLPNIEDDPFEKCAGDVHRKCFENAEKVWDQDKNTLKVFSTPYKCYKANMGECNYPILKHMNEFILAFHKHLKEKHGLLGHQVEEI